MFYEKKNYGSAYDYGPDISAIFFYVSAYDYGPDISARQFKLNIMANFH